MTIETAIAKLRKYYDVANKSTYVRNKIAWALYQVWKEADRERREDNGT